MNNASEGPAVLESIHAFLTRVEDALFRVVNVVVIVLVLSMTFLLFISVSSRYLLRYSIHWVDAYSRYSLIWITLLGTAIALRNGTHVGIPTLVEALPPKLRFIVEKFDVVAVLAYSVMMFYFGGRLIPLARRRMIPEMGFSISVIYVMIPVAAALMILVSIRLLISRAGGAITESEGMEDVHLRDPKKPVGEQ